jgi:hypothetical protein
MPVAGSRALSQQSAELRNNHVALPNNCGLGLGHHRCGVGVLCVGERNAARKKAAVKGLAQVKQDKITIHGPKNDGTYIVEFKTADGAWRSRSQCRGEARLPSWSTSKIRCPIGSRCRMSHGSHIKELLLARARRSERLAQTLSRYNALSSVAANFFARLLLEASIR